MFRLLLVSALATLALSACPPPSPPPQTRCSSSCGDACDDYDCTCKPVNTIPRPLSALARQAPLCYTFLPNTEYYNQLDNVCITLFPLFNNTEEFKIYESHVYCDGSVRIETYIGRSNGTGMNVWANPDRTFTNYVLGYADCGTYVKYRCGTCGDTNGLPFVFGMSPTLNSSESEQMQMQMLTVACQRQAESIATAQGLCTDNMYVLPNNLPGQCVYQEPCQPQDSPVYCNQQGACQPYVPPSQADM